MIVEGKINPAYDEENTPELLTKSNVVIDSNPEESKTYNELREQILKVAKEYGSSDSAAPRKRQSSKQKEMEREKEAAFSQVYEDDTKDNDTRNNLCLYGFIFVLVVLLCFIFAYYHSTEPKFTNEHNYQTVENFSRKVQEMKGNFTNQGDMFWRKIHSSSANHLKGVFNKNREDLRPFTMLIVGYQNSRSTLDCFIANLNTAFTYKSHTVIESNNMSKEELDESIISSLNQAQKYIVIKDIQKMPFQVANIFMSYADEYSSVASYPQSTMILTADVPFPFLDERKIDEERVARYFTTQLWNDDINNVSALWSRIGNILVLLKPEDVTNIGMCQKV